MSLIAKFNFHVRQARFNFNLHFLIGRLFYILHRRKLVKLSDHASRAMYIIATVQCGFQFETHMKPYFTLKPNEAFLDVGANAGMYTLLLAKKCKRVYAWEPEPKTFRGLEANTHRFKNVTLFNEALGEEEEILPFNVHFTSGHGSLVYQAIDFTGRVIKVPVKRLDSYDFPEKIGLIKVDTEGYEVPIIKGALKTIAKHKPRLILEMHMPYREHADAIKKMLPYYSWIRVYKEKITNVDYQFHLIGEPK